MPILQYRCAQCGKEFEELVKKYDDPVSCPDCGSAAERSYSGKVFSATGKPCVKCSGSCKNCKGCN